MEIGDIETYINIRGREFTIKILHYPIKDLKDYFYAEVLDGPHQGLVFLGSRKQIKCEN